MDGSKVHESVLLKFLSASSMPLPIVNVAYDANNNVEYLGIAMQGSLSSESVWRIEKLTWEDDGDGGTRYAASRYSKSGVIWDNRASLEYT